MTGAVVWITGLPASGKSTLAARVRAHLGPVVVLDGDEVREALAAGGFDRGGRDAFYATLGRLAALLAHQGHVVVVPATAPRRAHRDAARELAPRFVEVYVQTPLEVCAARDPKGLYAAARAGRAPALPGVGEPYEPPVDPDVIAGDDHDAAIAAIATRLSA
jgi:adenylylsulfate kinase